MASIATVLKSIQLDPGMNIPVKFHQNRLTPLASRAVHYIQTNRQTDIQTDGKPEKNGSLSNRHTDRHTDHPTDIQTDGKPRIVVV